MLGQPVSMLIPRVVGFKLTGELPAGTTATDLVLTITEMLRKHGVVGKFVEFYGEGVGATSLANRATIGNMSPEFGSTAAIFPIDDETLKLPAADRPLRAAGRARRGVRQGAGPVAGPGRRAGLLREAGARPVHRRAVDRRARSARRTASCWPAPPSSSPATCATTSPTTRRRARSPSRPPTPRPPHNGVPTKPTLVTAPDGIDVRDRPRRRHGRRDHLLHQHLEPVRHGRRRAGGEEGRREGPDPQAVGQDHPRPGLQGRHRLLRQGGPDPVPRQARLQPGRLRLHHLHRQLRARCPRRSPRRSTTPTSPSPRCSPATATSRAGSTPTSR